MYKIKLKCKNCDESFWEETEEGPGIFMFQAMGHICDNYNREVTGVTEVVAFKKKHVEEK